MIYDVIFIKVNDPSVILAKATLGEEVPKEEVLGDTIQVSAESEVAAAVVAACRLPLSAVNRIKEMDPTSLKVLVRPFRN